MDDVGYRRFVPAEADLLAEFLTTEDWPYHWQAGTITPPDWADESSAPGERPQP